MKKFWLGAAAIAALAIGAAAQARTEMIGAGVLHAFQDAQPASQGPGVLPPGSTQALRYGTWGFDISGMDTSVKPGDNFFRYANGRYMDRLEIPADRNTYGSFDMLRELSDNRLKALITEYAANGNLSPTSDEGKIAALYNSYMDTARIEALDAAPLHADLVAIRNLRTRSDFARYQGTTSGRFGSAFFGAFVTADQKAPSVNALYLFQGGLGLPNRDYYLEANFKDKKEAYQAYAARMLGMIGYDNAGQRAAEIVALETRIAEVSWTAIETRDDVKSYNPMTVRDLQRYAPGFDWKAYLQGAQVGDVNRVIATQNTAFPKIAKIFAETPIETLRAWQTFRLVDQAAPFLSRRFSDANFEFRGKTMSGQPAQRARDKRAITFAEGAMGEALGRDYVARYFPPESKAKMEKLVADIRSALAARIQNLAWMSPETKAKALEKLNKFRVKIGYPNKWLDYTSLSIDAADLYGNAQRAGEFAWLDNVRKLKKPVDKDEWGMTPQTVNAYYNPTGNEIVFPAAILQPPFFDPDADPAVNYGGIGGVIGHEIGHGFDDQGRQSDGEGVLRDWWTAQDAEKFVAQTRIYGAQYDQYEPLPGFHVQGGLTMGENIGDLAGITLALEAYRISLNGQPAPVLDGFTGDQRVFLGWAQVWRGKYRDASMQRLVASNPHSPPEFRVVGPMRNIDAWYEAFGVQPTDKYYLKPEDRVRLW
ncbi:MAG: peptidase M13 [Caulobacteraceae bacterium]|nr:peptidase M13 [Caulobacteraceae bacterium]